MSAPTPQELLLYWDEYRRCVGYCPTYATAATYFRTDEQSIAAVCRDLAFQGYMAPNRNRYLGNTLTLRGLRAAHGGHVPPVTPDALPAPVTPPPAVTIAIGEAKCGCGRSHFRIGATSCFYCQKRGAA